MQPRDWTTPEWDVFVFLGAGGIDETHLRAQSRPSTRVGSSGPPQRRSSKKRARASAAGEQEEIDMEGEHDPPFAEGGPIAEEGFVTPPQVATGSSATKMPSSEYSLRPPPSSSEAELLVTARAMESGMRETISILKEMASIDRSRGKLNSLKVQLACFPVGSAAHTRAMEQLEKHADEN